MAQPRRPRRQVQVPIFIRDDKYRSQSHSPLSSQARAPLQIKPLTVQSSELQSRRSIHEGEESKDQEDSNQAAYSDLKLLKRGFKKECMSCVYKMCCNRKRGVPDQDLRVKVLNR